MSKVVLALGLKLNVSLKNQQQKYKKEKTMNTFDKIKQWAHDRNLVHGSNPQAQMLKMTEEVGELAGAIAKKKAFEAADAIGDCIVVLTILSAQLNLDIQNCIDLAYNQIKDRKGQMVNGVFVKEE